MMIGITRSQENGVRERLRGSRSTMPGGAVAVAISDSPGFLQEFVGELLQVAGRLVDVLVLDELPHLVVDARRKRIGSRRTVGRAGDERVRLELGVELLGDAIQDAGGPSAPPRNLALLRFYV